MYTYGDIVGYSNSNRTRVVVGVTGDTGVGVDGTTPAGDAAELHRVGSCGTTHAVSSRQYPPGHTRTAHELLYSRKSTCNYK